MSGMGQPAGRAPVLASTSARVRTVDVAGVATSIVEGGGGPPLLLLHGGVESGAAIWAPVFDGLAATHRVVAPDLPGLGESEPLPALDGDSFASWLRGTMQALSLDRPTVVAHSLGGSLAARFAADAPGELSGLVVYGGPGVGPYRMPPRSVYCAIRFSLRPTAANAERFDRFLLYDLDATRARNPGWYRAFDEYNRAQARVQHVKKTMNRLVSLGTKRIPDEELRRIDRPVHLIWGRHDRLVPLKTAEAAVEAHGWPLHVVEDAAHAPHVEQPEAFLDVLRTIL
jgi:pimeloyl-ACP methyl ester carboxylesterase